MWIINSEGSTVIVAERKINKKKELRRRNTSISLIGFQRIVPRALITMSGVEVIHNLQDLYH